MPSHTYSTILFLTQSVHKSVVQFLEWEGRMECDKYVLKVLRNYRFGTFWSHPQIYKKTIGSGIVMKFKCTDKAAKSTKYFNFFLKMYLILRYQIVSSRTLCISSVHFNPTDFGTYKVAKCTDNFILLARVQRPVGLFWGLPLKV